MWKIVTGGKEEESPKTKGRRPEIRKLRRGTPLPARPTSPVDLVSLLAQWASLRDMPTPADPSIPGVDLLTLGGTAGEHTSILCLWRPKRV
jgi:hypothetical protein